MSKHTSTNKIANQSHNESLSSVIERRFNRRDFLYGSLQVAALTAMGGSLAGCNTNGNHSKTSQPHEKLNLGFESIAGSRTDGVVVPPGYTAQILIPWGTPLNDYAPGWTPESIMTADSQLNSIGMNHDGMYHFPLSDAKASEEFILAINHEYINPDPLWNWDSSQHGGKDFDHAADGGYATVRDAGQVRTEMNAHGISIVLIRKDSENHWAPVKNSPYNRRITSSTPVRLSGPVAGSDYVKTKYSTTGMQTRGTNSNCACGFTPWGTYLSCEENWPDYFRMGAGESRDAALDDAEYINADDKRLLVGQNHSKDGHSRGNNRWYAAATDPINDDGEFSRWYPYSTIAKDSNGAISSNDPTKDFRNEPRTFGYVVEVDPYSNTKAVKRTHTGRFRHEGCWLGKLVAGKPIVYYMGHDGLSEYLYRFVSEAVWDPADANRPGEQYDRLSIGDKYLDKGTLYVAKFHDDGSGEWKALTPDATGINSQTLATSLSLKNENDMAGLLVSTCDAADCMGATSLDRPEWGSVDPESGRFYVSCTNNWRRRGDDETVMGTYNTSDITKPGAGPDIVHTDAASPRYFSQGAAKGETPKGNEAGHILTLMDTDIGATTFNWDIFVFGAGANDPSNFSGLTEKNQFAQPDGLFYDDRGQGEGILWIETDNGYDPVESYTNNQLLAVIPARVSKKTGSGQSDSIINSDNQEQLRRFLVAPNGCEVTGIFTTPDKTALFVNIQHPGNWPASTSSTDATEVTQGTVRPRSATLVIQKENGGKIGV